ncbi:hypothetical protein HAZT_HAZT002711 [Hyalella azteca]|uniref:BTB domain-containing protein n=1 Tax=Hyalella azteca TaxID=294128 RepID=A0A6A0H538_HYAAZ|nr:hypothetical protein HAZT_HAZT002711 [Hyalella azteca]
MAEEHLSLKWNNHQAHFVDILTFLREKGMFVDVTLACGGKIYSAHKFVLSTCSDYFQKIFSKNTSTNPIVFMKDVSCNDIEALLDFMYHGEVNVPQSSLGSLIKTAEGLQIKGLAVPDDPPSSRVNDKDLNQESHDPEAHPASGADDASEQDAGPSGLRQSKQEEVEIKQEDVVELGEDDDDGVDWGGGMGDDGGGGDGNNDGLNSGDNSVSFSDVLLPPPEGGGGLMDGTGTGDSAMCMLDCTT